MQFYTLRLLRGAVLIAALTMMTGAAAASTHADANAGTRAPQHGSFLTEGHVTTVPIGWKQFCADYHGECDGGDLTARDVVLSQKSWADLKRVNAWVNDKIQPMTDMEHWGVVEHWDYPDDGYGDCEDYVLFKRKLLIQAGWPRQALLITVVRDRNGDGHAVLTVKTDKGEFILDNQNEEIVSWQDTGYRFVKRQSQINQNIWVLLGEPKSAPATVSAR
jgi:predicted transglutaminase-like cysteine proteinase